MSTTITAPEPIEPDNELPIPSPGQDVNQWGDILNEETFPMLLAYILWLKENGGGGGGPVDAEDVTYDNGTSGLTAEDVQNAIDEVYAAVVAGGIPAASGIVIARHGDDPDFPDPNTGGVTYWLGSVAPNNRKVGDLWLETDVFDGGS